MLFLHSELKLDLELLPLFWYVGKNIPQKKGEGLNYRSNFDWLILPVQLVPITTKGESLNLAHGEVYSIQHHVIKFVSDLRPVGGFSKCMKVQTLTNHLSLLTTFLYWLHVNSEYKNSTFIASVFKGIFDKKETCSNYILVNKRNDTRFIHTRARCGRDRMVVGFRTNCAISAHHH
jgi:hypothetical protein